MAEFLFPFPGRELADQELTYDRCYDKIPQQDRAIIVENAWQKGCRAAEIVFRRENGLPDFYTIARNSGLHLIEKSIDYVVGGQRYFSDYISGKNIINLYSKSIQMWADQNHFQYEQAVNLILSHEYYHYLEVNEIGLTSRAYQVPMIQIGPLKLGRTGIRALSEVGAHAFSRRYYELLQSNQEVKKDAEAGL